MLRRFTDWLKRRRAESEPATTLSPEQVIDIARRAATKANYPPELLTIATVNKHEGRLIWTVSAAAIGSSLKVEVEDESGAVIGVERVGLR